MNRLLPHRLSLLAAASALALCGHPAWAQADRNDPVQVAAGPTALAAADTVVVTGARAPVTLSSPIPSTVERVDATQIEQSINTVTSAGALQYLPSVHVRERYIGDRNGVLVMRVNSSVASAQTTVYADGLLLSNFLANSFSTAPRWGLVSPEEIDRIDVLYGPFSALYPGNSAGGVVRMHTRTPTRFEAHVKLDLFSQRFEEFGTAGSFNGKHASASLGHAIGDWTFRLALDHLSSLSQPQTFGTATRTNTVGTVDVSGSPVIRDTDTAGQPRIVVSSTGIDDTEQDMLKLKLGYRFSPAVSANYTLGLWQNRGAGSVVSYLRDANGRRVSNGTVRLDGVNYNLSAAVPSLSRSEHWLHGLALNARTGAFQWELDASLYDQKLDTSRTAAAVPALDTGAGPVRGTLLRADGTGWHNLDLRGQWRLNDQHTLSFGAHHDRYKLANVTTNEAEWVGGTGGALASNSFGKTRTDALYLQDEWRVAPDWTLLVGGRKEHWRAYEGSNFSATAAAALRQLNYAERASTDFSPKLHLGWKASSTLDLNASVGKAVRYPTVSEMFQTFSGPTAVRQNDPNLRPESVLSTELSAKQQWERGMLRASWFHERKTDALISQTDTTVTPNFTSIQNVDRVLTQGLELAFQAQPAAVPQLELNGSLTYTHSLIAQNSRNPGLEGTVQPRIPDWRATLVGVWHASDELSYSLSYRFSGRQHNALFNTTTKQYSDPNPNVYGAVSHYSVFDAKANWKVNKQWTASVGINNVGSFKYYVNPNPYPQRTFFATLKYDL
ncbi:outer membrane receptor protein [Burkholderiales bacterium JOSHI_001]|nr:outer membrane receptor protein [Burkholderiales bacterium JOSHI_001]